MDNKELIRRLFEFNEEETKEVNKEQSESQDDSSEGFVFDLNKIPKKVLDRAWTRYRPYLYVIDHDSPLNIGIYESTNYAEQARMVRNELVKVFPLKRDLFKIFPRYHKMFAILVADMEDNATVVQKIMEDNGFFRSRPTDEEVKKDDEGRVWRQMWFEPIHPDDITEDLHRRFHTLYHLTPSVNEENVKKEGLKASNNNPRYRYSESRVFFMEGEATDKEK